MDAAHDLVLVDITAATMAAAGYGLIADAAIAVTGGRLSYVGPRAGFPGAAGVTIEGRGGLVTPGLIDCHTHLVHGGSRAAEFEQRLRGASYEQIARAGGGILSTVRATRALSEDALVAASLPRLDALLAEGVTTVEIKSGYGLTTASELRMLRAARRLAALRPVDIRATLLAAHAIPPEQGADAYVRIICEEMIPDAAAEGLADAVDGFCETIAFSPAQIEAVFTAARAHGLPVKLHAEQLSNLGGAVLAARHGALSADHLEYLDQAGVDAMAASGTVAVLLPGAFYFLRETQAPPVAALRAAGVPMALATDCNPGSSPFASVRLILNMACTLFRMTPEEALAGVTVHAARALGLADRGRLAPGLRADLVLWRIDHPAELAYAVGLNSAELVLRDGRVTKGSA
jgi:imidazolonepropionase